MAVELHLQHPVGHWMMSGWPTQRWSLSQRILKMALIMAWGGSNLCWQTGCIGDLCFRWKRCVRVSIFYIGEWVMSLVWCERNLPDLCSCSPSPHTLLSFGAFNACRDGTEKYSDLKDFCNLDIHYQLPFEWTTRHPVLLTSCLLDLVRLDQANLAKLAEEASPAAGGSRVERLNEKWTHQNSCLEQGKV